MTNDNEIKKEIVLPQYEWFVNKKDNKPVSNIFTGSYGTDKQHGCATSTIFNYKVHVVDVGKDTANIVGECYISKPWNNQNKKELLSVSKAECSYSGLNDISLWLNKELKKFIENKTNGGITVFEIYKNKIQEMFGPNNSCPHYVECRKYVKYSNCNKIIDKFVFDRARIGELYGVENNIPKIVMVGIEGFSSEQVISTVIHPALTDRAVNPHYRGVKYILAYLLADFLGKDKPQPKITKKGVPWVNDALKRYTLCNLYKCAFVPENEPDKEKGLCHTREMSSNCINLLIKEIKILEPDIIVIQSSNDGVFTETMRTKLYQEFSCKKTLDIDGSAANLYEGYVNSKHISIIRTMHGSDWTFKTHNYIENCLNPILDKAIEIYESTN